jgi:plasmid stabilization system protein ParE
MGYPVILTPQSQKDLERIVKYIRRDSPSRAKSFGNALIDKALTLSPFPEIGRVVPELDDPNVREIIHGSYRIIYEITSDPSIVYILRFWHAARGIPSI